MEYVERGESLWMGGAGVIVLLDIWECHFNRL